MILSLILLVTNLSFAQEANVPSVLENRQGIEALKKQNPGEAQKHFLDALSKNPLEPRLQLNLGYSFEQMGQMEKARSAYDTAAKLGKDNESLFVANFNRGALYQKEKKTEEALAAYQEALKYKEDSIEAKTNIELLVKDEEGKGKDQKEQQDKKDGDQGQDSKDQKSEGNDQQDQKDQKDQDKDGDQKKDQNKPKEYAKNKPQPKPFKSEELTQGDVNKILGEIKQQEQKIRAEFNKRDTKEQGREKDW